MKTRTAITALLFAACASDRSSTPPAAPPASSASTPQPLTEFDWPVPAGWKHETIPFPLEFAPELPYHGLEELRFAPGFFKPDASTYWSYDFVWWVEDPPKFDAELISAVLRDYFRGLALAVGKDKFSLDPDKFRADLAPKSVDERTVLVGQVHSYDPFATGLPIVLNVEASLRSCPASAHSAITFLVSPKSVDDPVWTELRECASAFRCK
jgi:hypothetical protein